VQPRSFVFDEVRVDHGAETRHTSGTGSAGVGYLKSAVDCGAGKRLRPLDVIKMLVGQHRMCHLVVEVGVSTGKTSPLSRTRPTAIVSTGSITLAHELIGRPMRFRSGIGY
jgi:hypothetical protein